MASSFFFLLLLVVAASPLQTQARESRFFSKVTRPETANPKPEPESVSPVSTPAKEATPEKGYGLFGEEEKETYQYSPTTANPTKSAAGKFEYLRPSGGDTSNNGYRFGAGEKQGMSDTRFLENGRYFHDIKNEEKVEGNGNLVERNEGHESFYGNNYKSEKSFTNGGYGAMEKQGMSDTRFLENGRYFYDVQAEKNTDNVNEMQTNNVEFNNNNNDDESDDQEEEEDEGEDQKYDENRGYRTEEKQGMTGTRFSDTGRYFYDTKSGKSQIYNGQGSNAVLYDNSESYEPQKLGGYEGESYNNGAAEKRKYSGNGNGYDFRGTPNRFPSHEFDSMEEYEKYEQSKSQMNGYRP